MVIAATIVAVYLIGVFFNILGVTHLVQINIEKLYEDKPSFWNVLSYIKYDNTWWLSWVGVVFYFFLRNGWNE